MPVYPENIHEIILTSLDGADNTNFTETLQNLITILEGSKHPKLVTIMNRHLNTFSRAYHRVNKSLIELNLQRKKLRHNNKCISIYHYLFFCL